MNGSTDYVEFYGYQNSGNVEAFLGGSVNTHASGTWVGPAS